MRYSYLRCSTPNNGIILYTIRWLYPECPTEYRYYAKPSLALHKNSTVVGAAQPMMA